MLSLVPFLTLVFLFVTPVQTPVLPTPPAGSLPGSPGAEAVPRVSVDQLRGLLDAGAALVVDVRVAAAYDAGHIRGAINVSLPDVEARARALRDQARGRTIVAYCSCPEEHASVAAATILMRAGVPGAAALVGGYPAWVKAGGAVDR